MSAMQQYYRASIGFGRPWTPVVRALILANGAMFLINLLGRMQGEDLVPWLGLDTAAVFGQFRLWQLASYMFLHGGFFHLLFNMFALWMFGSDLEDYMGQVEFTYYYFFCGIGAGIVAWGVDLLRGEPSYTIGASGAIFGILLAYGVIWSRREITLLVFFVLPVTLQARVFVLLFAALELFLGVSGSGGPVAHFAHLGGMLFGLLYFKLLRNTVRPYLQGKRLFAARSRLRLWNEQDDRERLDQVLDKINRYGIHTLSEGEKKFLDRMSRRAH
jgi:membrane associated rhomboid family serine protease